MLKEDMPDCAVAWMMPESEKEYEKGATIS
jgi:hypothetical protein